MKLVMTDIDGTIRPWSQKVVPVRVRESIRAAKAAGIMVGPASGRGYSWVSTLFDGDDDCFATCLATNGMQVFHNGEKILEKTLDPSILARAAEVAASFPHGGLVVFDGATPLLVTGELDDLMVSFRAYAEMSVPVDGVPDAPVVKANAFVNADEATTHEFADLLRREVPEFDFDVPNPGFTNIMPAGWNKGAGLLYLRDYLGVAPQDVIVFGDAGNDLTLFEAAEHSVAVANATPEAAAAARWHIGSVEECAVADALDALAAGEWPFSE